jgi:hypothetical protein
VVISLIALVTSCSAPESSVEVKTTREEAVANCDARGKCIKDPKGSVLYNDDIITKNNILKRSQNETLLTRLMNLTDEPRLLVTTDTMENLMRGVTIIGALENCDSLKKIEGENPTLSQLKSLAQGRYKVCVAYIGEGLVKRIYALDAIEVDKTPPVVQVGLTASGPTENSAQLTWQKASDNLSLEGTLSFYAYTSTSHSLTSLDDVQQYGNQASVQVINSTTFVIKNLQGNTLYHAAIVVMDEAGNQALVGATDLQTLADLTAPSSPSIIINASASITTTTSSNLTLSAGDASEMYITNTATCSSGGSWETYNTSKSTWILSQTNATATVYAKFRDIANNETECVSDSIVHDNIAPQPPAITIASKTFNASFTTSIQQNAVSDSNFKEFRYTTTVTEPTCSSGTASSTQPTSITIPASNTTLKVITCDQAGQASTVAQATYTFDNTRPSVTISSTAQANTNVSPIPFTISFSESVTNFVISDLTVSNGTTSGFSGSGNTYTVNVIPSAQGAVTIDIAADVAQDAATNGNTAAIQLSRTYDTVSPSSPSLSINSGANYTSSTASTLTLSADGSPDQMYITNTAGCASGGSWEAYATSKSWTLGQTNSTTTVYAKFKDLAGNETACVNDTIIHDNNVPQTPVIVDASKSFNSSFMTSIQQNSTPDTNFKEFRYTTTGIDPNCSSGTASSTQPTSITIPASNTTLKVITCDQVNLASAVVTSVFTYDITPPNAPNVMGITPTANTTPAWTWSSGGGGGNGTYRYKLNSPDLSSGATETTSSSFTPGSPLAETTHRLYVQERDSSGNWSTSGSFDIQVVIPPAAPTLATPYRYTSSLGINWSSVSGATSYNLYWSTSAGVTTDSTKISNVSSVYTHSPLTGGTTYYYKLAAVKSGIEGTLSNEVNAVPYTFVAPTISTLLPNSGSAAGSTAVTITGSGFQSGATVTIGGNSATAVTVVNSTSITATTPAGSAGSQNVVVTNTDGQNATLTGGFLYRPACAGDCYLEGTSPNYAQDLAIGTERQGPSDVTMSLQFADGISGFKIWKEKGGTRILNATGVVVNGWQKQLTRAGTAFSAADFTTGSNITGRVCPPNVFLSHSNMTATGRCLYYDAGTVGMLRLDAAAGSGTESEDWLSDWSTAATGRGTGLSHYEGNIKTCADKGMRLPVMYETTMNTPPNMLPSGDSITPTWAGSANGVPAAGTLSWTSGGYPAGTTRFWCWSGTSSSYWDSYFERYVRCVLP